MRKKRAKKIWDDTMELWGNQKLHAMLSERFSHPKRMYRNMKRAWVGSREEYVDTVALGKVAT